MGERIIKFFRKFKVWNIIVWNSLEFLGNLIVCINIENIFIDMCKILFNIDFFKEDIYIYR